MKLARVFAAAAAVAIGLGLSLSCSDPPSPPAQAAVVITIQPISGQGFCPSGPPYYVPADPAVQSNLSCDPAKSGCTPDDVVVVDGDKGASVECTVKPSGDGFEFSISLSIDKMNFSASATGPIPASGGKVYLSEWDVSTQVTLSDPECVLTIRSIKAGAVLGSFECGQFADQGAAAEPACTASGKFIFENCSS